MSKSVRISAVTDKQAERIAHLKRLNQALIDYADIPSVVKSLRAEIKQTAKEIVEGPF